MQQEETKQTGNQKILLACTTDGYVNHWNIASGKLSHSIHIEGNAFKCCDYSTDGLKFVAAGTDRNVYLFDEYRRQLETTMHSNGLKLEGPASHLLSVKGVPSDSNLFLTGGWDRTIRIYDVRAGKPVGIIMGPNIHGDTIDMNGDEILVGNYSNKAPL